MYKSIRRLLAILLTVAFAVSAIPHTLADNDEYQVTLSALQAQYPHGMYWNGGDPLSYTDIPCTHHGNCSENGTKYDGSCGCNSYRGLAIQCMGYAYQLASLVYGGSPYRDWLPYYGEDALDRLKAGDIIRYKGHSIFVYAVDGENVIFTDCNWNGTCNIRWDQTITKEELRADFKYVKGAPYAWDVGPITCGCSVTYAGEYTCTTETLSLSIRDGHGTYYPIIGSIPPGATVTVSKASGDTPESWAHVEYNGIHGYASMSYLKNNHEHFYSSDCDTVCDCGEPRGTETAHTFGEYVYNEDATYLTDGTKTRTCTLCQEPETVSAEGTRLVNPFGDVPEEEFFFTPVLWALDNRITTGTSETEFSPEESCTRGQIVTFLWRAAGEPAPETAVMPFTDLTEEYYYNAILWAVEKGITNGTAETTFSPEEPCTRGQIVTFLWRAAGEPAPETAEMPFTDLTEEYYYNAILWAVEKGITNGTDKNTFSPEEPCTRGQSVTFLYRYFNQTE